MSIKNFKNNWSNVLDYWRNLIPSQNVTQNFTAILMLVLNGFAGYRIKWRWNDFFPPFFLLLSIVHFTYLHKCVKLFLIYIK